MTQIYQSTKPLTTYWTLPKFLSRSTLCIDKLTLILTQQVQKVYSKGVYVYDETHSTNNGTKQYGTHYYRNNRYNRRNKNQSQYHHGHECRCYWLVKCDTPQSLRLFPLAVRVMYPGETEDNSLGVLSSICDKMPAGLIVFDRGFNRRKVFTKILSQGHHLLCRAKSNAVFYHIPTPLKELKRGRPRIYGSRVYLPYLKYRDLLVDNETYSSGIEIYSWIMKPILSLTKLCKQRCVLNL